MVKFWNNLKIWPKLLLIYSMGAVVPMLFIGIYLIVQVYQVSFDNTMSTSLASLVQLQSNYVSYLENCAATTRRVTHDPGIVQYVNTRYPAAFDAIMDFQKNVAPLARPSRTVSPTARLRVFSDNESIYFSQEMSNDLGTLEAEEWYMPSATNVKGELSWAVTGSLTGSDYGPGVICYTPLSSSVGEDGVSHVAAVFFEEAPLYKFVLTESFFGNRVFLIDGGGRIVTSTERERVLGKLEDIGLSKALTTLQTGDVLHYEDEAYFCQVQPLLSAEAPLNSWQVIRLMPAEGIYHSVVQAIFPGLLLFLFGLLFGLLLILLTASNLRRRVSRLNHSMLEVMDSGFEKRLSPTGRDEIGDIERNFALVAQETGRLIHEVYENKLAAAQLLGQKKEAQLLALRGQINPHYLFNTLESIRMNLVLSGDRNTARIIHLFAESFRACIEGDGETCTLAQELQFLTQYFAIQQYRMRDKISLHTDIPVQVLNCRIPRLMLQPLVENAVYHGLELKEEAGQVSLCAQESDGVLLLTVTDDGIGMEEERLRALRCQLSRPEDAPAGGDCLALRNVNSRLRLMYGADFGLEIESEPGRGTCLQLRLPAMHEKEEKKEDVSGIDCR